MWEYNGVEFLDENVGDYVGFVYIITNKKTNKKYIGKKLFTQAAARQVKGKRKKYRKASNWKEYFGSNKILVEDVAKMGSENFSREILHLCTSKGWCSVWETFEILNRKALWSDDFYNEWISMKVRRSHLK